MNLVLAKSRGNKIFKHPTIREVHELTIQRAICYIALHSASRH